VWDVLIGTEEARAGVMVTTFSSHIARIRAIIEAAHKMDRKPVLLGRSMEKYWSTAVRTGYAGQEDVAVFGRRKSVDKALKKIMTEGKDKYLPIMTGHQGEPGAILSRVAGGETDYQVESGDRIIFSAGIIPQPLNESNRHTVVTKLKMRGGRIYDNVHVSGHACREDRLGALANDSAGACHPQPWKPCHTRKLLNDGRGDRLLSRLQHPPGEKRPGASHRLKSDTNRQGLDTEVRRRDSKA